MRLDNIWDIKLRCVFGDVCYSDTIQNYAGEQYGTLEYLIPNHLFISGSRENNPPIGNPPERYHFDIFEGLCVIWIVLKICSDNRYIMPKVVFNSLERL